MKITKHDIALFRRVNTIFDSNMIARNFKEKNSQAGYISVDCHVIEILTH